MKRRVGNRKQTDWKSSNPHLRDVIDDCPNLDVRVILEKVLVTERSKVERAIRGKAGEQKVEDAARTFSVVVFPDPRNPLSRMVGMELPAVARGASTAGDWDDRIAAEERDRALAPASRAW